MEEKKKFVPTHQIRIDFDDYQCLIRRHSVGEIVSLLLGIKRSMEYHTTWGEIPKDELEAVIETVYGWDLNFTGCDGDSGRTQPFIKLG